MDALDKLKHKTILDYNKFIKNLVKGKRTDYELIIEEINVIELYSYLDNPDLKTEYFINYEL